MDPGAGARGMELVLLHEINAGTFARLYLAETRGSGGLDRIVAVKILREQWGEQQDIVNRTRDEARLLARLRHRNILRVEDLVEVDGQTAIIMEYVDGLDLKQLVDGLREIGQRLPAKVALQISVQAASALEAAYFRVPTGLEQPLRVIHRDLKPSNIMVSTEGEVRVLDFGTARSSHIFRSAQTGAMRFGSLKYMSPERREGDRGEHAGDVYALGLVLLELLRTEWLPLLPMDTDEHDAAIAQAVARIDHLGLPNPEWDAALRGVLTQMLASDPAVRPSADQVVKLLHAFVEQASGPVLDRFAAETVQPMAERLRPQNGGGALAGRRLLVSAVPDFARGSDPRQGPQPAARPARAPAGSGPRSAPQRSAAPEPIRAASPRHAPPRDPPAAEGGSGRTMIAVGAGAAVLVAVGAVLLLAIGGGVWWYSRSGTPAVSDGGLATPVLADAGLPGADGGGSAPGGGGAAATGGEPPPPPPPTGVAVSVAVGGQPAQWVQLDQAGVRAAEGRGALTTVVPEGEYDLAIKLVGREAVRASIKVPAAGLTLSCEPDARSNLRCTGGARPVTLKP